MNITLSLKGLADVKRALIRLKRNVAKDVLRPAVEAGLDVLDDELYKQVPVKTGALRATMNVKVRKPRKGRVSGTLSIGDAAHPYAASDEYGNHHQEGQRFLTRTFDIAAPRAVAVALAHIKAHIARLA